MGRRFKKKTKNNKQKSRKLDRVASKQYRKRALIYKAKRHVVNLANYNLTDDEYIILGKGLKFIPKPKAYNVRKSILKDFDIMARKMRCRYHFHDSENVQIHPFRVKSNFQPAPTCHELETYLDLTKLEISSMELENKSFNFSKDQYQTLLMLKNKKDIILSKSDKGGAIVISKREHYINEGLRQLNSNHYREIDQPDLQTITQEFRTYFLDLHKRGEIDGTTTEFLCGPRGKNPRLGRLFLLPKIHKLNKDTIANLQNRTTTISQLPPCRPIISQCNAVTERISQFIDYFLLPIVKRQNSYIRDSGDFINQIENLHPNANCLLVSFDCTSMYTMMEFNELISAVGRAYDNAVNTDYTIKLPTKDTIVSFLSYILQNNYFEFNGKCYQQMIGASMGSKCSPEICDIRAFEIINEIFNKFNQTEYIAFYGRYRDDGFLIYDGSLNDIKELFHIANNHHPFLKFTYNVSETEMVFLDTTVYKGTRFDTDGILDIRSYIKPTNTHQYLDRSSMHNPSVFNALIKGETLRHCRNNSNIQYRDDILGKFKHHLIERGYKSSEIDKSMNSALNKNRSELLQFRPRINRQIPLVFITKFHFSIRKINKLLRKHFRKLQKDDRCKEIFAAPPMIAYSKHRNLKDILTSSILK